MVEITPFGLLFVGSCCLSLIGLIVLAILLYIAFVPKSRRPWTKTKPPQSSGA